MFSLADPVARSCKPTFALALVDWATSTIGAGDSLSVDK